MIAIRRPILKRRIVDSITRQTEWPCDYFNFGKAMKKGVDYFNCGIVNRPDGTWLVARRTQPHPHIEMGMNDLVAFLLEDKIPVWYVKADIPHVFKGLEHFEDPRAIYHNGKTYVSCCNFIIRNKGWTGAHQILVEMDDKWKTIKRHDPVYGTNGADLAKQTGIEKNWLWFFHAGFPHLVYQTHPHTVARWDLDFKEAFTYTTEYDPPWEWGEPRGGTPPVRVGNEYWSFFHSATNWREQAPVRQYHMGAYAFDATLPFRITKMTAEPLLSGSPYDRWGDRKPLVVFPNGAILRNGIWTVTMGVNDLDSAWIDIPHVELEQRVVAI